MDNDVAIIPADPAFDNAERALAEAHTLADVVNVRDQAEAIRTLMARQKRGLEWQNKAAEIKLRAERKAGEILAEMPRASGPGRGHTEKIDQPGGSFTATIDDAGIPATTARRWQQVAAIPEPVFEEHIVHTKQAESELTTAGLIRAQKLAPMMSSASAEWYTPQHIVDCVLHVLGDIDLDPCSDPDRSVSAIRHYTKADDGLKLPWNGRVYMNPPYGDVIKQWTKKLALEFVEGRTTEAIALVPARVDTQWWADFDSVPGVRVCFLRGRLRFSGAEASAPFPSAVVYLGPNSSRFRDVFGTHGTVWAVDV